MEKSRDLAKGLDSILHDNAPEELWKWWDRVLLTAREFCDDPQGRFVNIDVLLLQKRTLRGKDVRKAQDCIRRAIEHHLKSMPNITGETYMQMIKNLGNKR
jgi:hypothetical protein